MRVVKAPETGYLADMVTLSKLLLLVVMLFMPFGMSSVAAASHHAPAASMPMQHCPEQGSKHDSKGGFAECTMACAAALPAADSRADGSPLIVTASIVPGVLQALHGLHPDTATPPPKVS
jgi:hypothetical protein